jgi:hypothetical protein
MSAITPQTSMPADGASPSGMVTTSLPKLRFQAVCTDGAADLYLITKYEGGQWAKVPGAVLRLDSAVADKASGAVIVDNPIPSTAYHVLKERSGTVAAYIAGSALTASLTDLSVTDLAVGGDATVGDDLTVTGDAAVGATLAVTGAATLSSTLAVTGASTLTGQLNANGGAKLAGSAPSAAADAVTYGVADINGATTAAEKKNYEGGASLTERVHGTGAAKQLLIAQDLADDGSISLPAPAAGKVGRLEINEITEWGLYSVQSDGTITKLAGSTNAVTTDTDTKLAVFSSTGTPTLRNRLGSTLPFVGRYLYF